MNNANDAVQPIVFTETLIRAVADHLEATAANLNPETRMVDSILLNLREARVLAERGSLGDAKASILRASRYTFGILSDEHTKICWLFGEENDDAAGFRSKIGRGHVEFTAS